MSAPALEHYHSQMEYEHVLRRHARYNPRTVYCWRYGTEDAERLCGELVHSTVQFRGKASFTAKRISQGSEFRGEANFVSHATRKRPQHVVSLPHMMYTTVEYGSIR